MQSALYNGTQTVTYADNGDGTITQTTSYNNTAFNAMTTSIAALSGGLAAGLAGANAQAGATWAENEAQNNTESTKSTTSSVVQSVLYGLMPWLPGNPLTQAVGSTITSTAQGVMSQIQANYGGQTPPADASNQLADGNNGGNNTPPTAGAVVTPAPCPAGPGACGMVVSPVVTPGAPILSSGNGSGESDGNAPSSANAGASGSSGPTNNSAQQALNAVANNNPAVATNGGFINGTKIDQSGSIVQNLTSSQQALVQQIVQNGDSTGSLTEALVDSVSESGGYQLLSGGKYGSNNGFDQVLQAPDGSVTIVADSKQIGNGGGVSLGSSQAGTQLSQNWIEATLENLPDGSPAKTAVQNAQNKGTLYTAVAGVNKTTGNLVIVPVNVR